MRVPLDVDGSQGERSIVVTALLNHGSIRSRRPARFIIDTGSPVTLMSETLRQQLQIPQRVLESDDPMYGLGGGQVPTSRLENVEFQFKSNGLTDGFEQDVLVSEGHQENILGLDFFEGNNLDLHCEGNGGDLTAYFEG